MYFVYSLLSANEEHWYVGITNDIKRRVQEHNNDKSPHTSKFGPWLLKSYTAFSDKQKAQEFEKYLKSHSGRAFAKKHL